MFRSMPDAEPAADVIDPGDVIPITHLALDLGEPAGGWHAYLASRDIAIVHDDLGRVSIARNDARRLFTEHHEAEERKARKRKLVEAQAVADDQIRRSRIWTGVPADHLPPGVAPAVAMLSAARDSQPRRRTPLEEQLDGESLIYHSLRSAPDDEW
jgi:hypothetical protein